ncbi:MAG: hypothetical protein ABL998_06670 [Planctomycetota bacterium]
MGNYRVLLHGHNLWLELEGKVQHVGFYLTRFVEASSALEAERRALDVVESEPHVRAAKNRRDDPPFIDVSESVPVARADVPKVAPGYALYPVEESEVA